MNHTPDKPDFDFSFEGLSTDELVQNFDLVEVPIKPHVFRLVGLCAFLIVGIVVVRMIAIGPFSYAEYRARAVSNLEEREIDPAPRGIITDRNDVTLAENEPSFLAFLRLKDFLASSTDRGSVLLKISEVIKVPPEQIELEIIQGISKEKEEILIGEGLDEAQIIAFRASKNIPVTVRSGFRRRYVDGPVFATILGYTGRVDAESLSKNPKLKDELLIGKAGIEAYYDDYLRGVNGYKAERQNALGVALNQAESVAPVSGKTLKLTIDSGLQKYFYTRLSEGLRSLGRDSGVGLVLNPQTGEVLAMISLPTYDNTILSSPGRNEEKQKILSAPSHPFFNRAVSGFYSPGSTIKPLVAVAALKEKVITPDRSIYSPGYLDVPNPYDPSKPSRFLDWRPQGYVNVMSAIAQSSNVYFYEIGGGFGDIKGLGITKLLAWWDMFGLGKEAGIDIVGEGSGRLPEPEKSEEKRGRAWLLGDTYNVSIGQGDLQVTPLQILNYIATIANGGTLRRPYLASDIMKPEVIRDLSHLSPEIRFAQKGMELGVKSTLGTGHSLVNLPISIAAKTGTAQTQNNTVENAFFVGYAPTDKPEIAVLVLVENAKQGSLNAVPIAKDVFEWYHLYRYGKDGKSSSTKQVSGRPA
ncbi:MAG: penicillin-binding transpeptidase domain-containing protein [Patescibacteria group bacterium]